MNAKKRTDVLSEQMKCGSIDTACKRYDFGKNTMRRVGEDANAIIRIGKSVYYNFSKIDTYIDAISQ